MTNSELWHELAKKTDIINARYSLPNPEVSKAGLADLVTNGANTFPREVYIPGMQKDMGLGDYRIEMKHDPNLRYTDVAGFYDKKTGSIGYESRKDGSTMMHELMHARDHIFDQHHDPVTWFGVPIYGNEAHHKYYRNFDTDMAEQLLGQSEVENHGRLPKHIQNKFPWLDMVKPYSSNRIPLPGPKKAKIHPMVYNLKREWHPPLTESWVPDWLRNLE